MLLIPSQNLLMKVLYGRAFCAPTAGSCWSMWA